MNRSVYFRILILLLCTLLVWSVFGLEFFKLQVVDGETYAQKAQSTSIQSVTVKAARGEIVDRYGRPIAVNTMGFNVTFEYTFFPESGSEQNAIIAHLMDLLTQQQEDWIHNLPLVRTSLGYAFVEGMEKEVERLKKVLGLQSFATAQNVFDEMCAQYEIPAEEDPERALAIAAVRYEMQRREFSRLNPYTFAEDVSMETVTYILENQLVLPGVEALQTSQREYVTDDLLTHIVGRIGPIYAEEYQSLKAQGYAMNDTVGKYGIESALEQILRGEDGVREIETDAEGKLIRDEIVTPAQAGQTVMLTIDLELQRASAKALAEYIRLCNETMEPGKGKEAKAGALVAIEVDTGEVLAMVTYPSYSAEEYSTSYSELVSNELKPLINRAVNEYYAPGSTFKPITATAGLAEGLISTRTLVNCQHVYTYYTDYQPKCLNLHGKISLRDAIKYSCNIFFYDIGRQLGIERLASYGSQYGLGRATGIEIPESIGQMSSRALRESQGLEWNRGDILQTAIGQSYTQLTPLQLANYTATIARQGTLLEAHLVDKILSYDMTQVAEEKQPVILNVIDCSEEDYDYLTECMIATSREGTCYGTFGTYPIDVASKTGTPQTDLEGTNSVFICFAPAEKPEIAVGLVIEGGYSSAPVAKAVLDQYFFGSTASETVDAENVLLS